MKVFTFKYKKGLDNYILSEMKKAISTHTPSIHSNILYFDNLDDLMRSASKARLELFQSILEKKPTSIYELAQQVNKDQSYILRETRALASMGLIQLVEIKEGGREKLKPEALYEKIVIDVDFQQEKQSTPPTTDGKKEVA